MTIRNYTNLKQGLVASQPSEVRVHKPILNQKYVLQIHIYSELVKLLETT